MVFALTGLACLGLTGAAGFALAAGLAAAAAGLVAVLPAAGFLPEKWTVCQDTGICIKKRHGQRQEW